MKVKETLIDDYGLSCQDIDDMEVAMAESYYYGTLNSVVDLIRLYGKGMVLNDIDRILDQWDSDK